MPALALLVLRCHDLARSRQFYEAFGLTFVEERHGGGPAHLAATLDDGMVLELYPSQGPHGVDPVRLALTVLSPGSTARRLADLGFTVDAARPLATDPDTRSVEIHGTRPRDVT